MGGQRPASWAPGPGTKCPLYWRGGTIWGACQILYPSAVVPAGPSVQACTAPPRGGLGRSRQARQLHYFLRGHFLSSLTLGRANTPASWPPLAARGAPTMPVLGPCTSDAMSDHPYHKVTMFQPQHLQLAFHTSRGSPKFTVTTLPSPLVCWSTCQCACMET